MFTFSNQNILHVYANFEHFISQLKIPNHLCHSSKEYFSQSQYILLATCLGKDDTAPNDTDAFAGINGKYALMRDPVLKVNTHTCVIRSEWVKGCLIFVRILIYVLIFKLYSNYEVRSQSPTVM